jgi:hypothetical protein
MSTTTITYTTTETTTTTTTTSATTTTTERTTPSSNYRKQPGYVRSSPGEDTTPQVPESTDKMSTNGNHYSNTNYERGHYLHGGKKEHYTSGVKEDANKRGYAGNITPSEYTTPQVPESTDQISPTGNHYSNKNYEKIELKRGHDFHKGKKEHYTSSVKENVVDDSNKRGYEGNMTPSEYTTPQVPESTEQMSPTKNYVDDGSKRGYEGNTSPSQDNQKAEHSRWSEFDSRKV